jgi:hypothetical protein
MTSTRVQAATALTIAVTGLLMLPAAGSAQAWVPEKGEGSVSLLVQQLNNKKHLQAKTEVDAGHMNTGVLLAGITYGVSDKLALDVAIPYVVTKYSGTKAHPNTNIDNGAFHNSFTDVRMSVRYNLTRRGAVITPYIGSVVPSHDYQYYGHSAFGEQLNELQVGTFIAKLFTSGLPGTFVSSRVAYGFVEKVQNISHNRSMADIEGGYFLTPSFRTFGMVSGQYTHGGITLPPGGFATIPAPYKFTHDVIQRVHYVNVGGGFAYSMTDSLDLFGSFTRQVAGLNGHKLNRGVSLGVSWTFSRGAKGEATTAGAGAPAGEYARITAKREGSLGRCICQRSGT